MKDVIVIEHPLVQHYLSILRDKTTGKTNFKYSLEKISYLLASYIYSTLRLEDITISTPLKRCKGKKVKDEVVILPVLRAGLGFMQGFVDLLPSAVVGHIGMYRDEKTLEPVKYYFNFPERVNKRFLKVIVLDPMIATGGSIIYTIEHLHRVKIYQINVVSLLCAPEGINAIKKRFNNNIRKDIKILTCGIDEKLSKDGFIVPGLGDAGDRIFGT